MAVPSPAMPAALALLAVLSGCAQVTIRSGDGTVVESSRLGILSLETKPGTTAQLVDLRGVGVVSQNGGVTLGYLASRHALLPTTDCRIVIWVDEGAVEQPRALQDLLANRSDICAVGPGAGPVITRSAGAD